MDVIKMLWTEQYRPKTLDGVLGQENHVARLKIAVKKKKIPNLLIAGPPGNGKTSTAIAMLMDYFEDEETYEAYVLELNASDDRGIKVVREDIKKFAEFSVSSKYKIRVIILDEADSMTSDAQHALRRTIENYPHVRFILICNYSSKIISPIQSRCTLLRFKPVPQEAIVKRLEMICNEQKVKYTKEGVESIVVVTEGDMRKMVNYLEMLSLEKKEINKENVYELAGKIIPEEIERIFAGIEKHRNIQVAINAVNKLIYRDGFDGQDIIEALIKHFTVADIPAVKKLYAFEKLAEIDFRISDGSKPNIQLYGFFTGYLKIASRTNKK